MKWNCAEFNISSTKVFFAGWFSNTFNAITLKIHFETAQTNIVSKCFRLQRRATLYAYWWNVQYRLLAFEAKFSKIFWFGWHITIHIRPRVSNHWLQSIQKFSIKRQRRALCGMRSWNAWNSHYDSSKKCVPRRMDAWVQGLFDERTLRT